MFENEAKGWHGSYSSVGRISAEKYPMILMMDQMIKGGNKKKKVKDYFSTEEAPNNRLLLVEENDVFEILSELISHFPVPINTRPL